MKKITLTFGGNPYTLTGLSSELFQEFLDYGKSKLPDPMTELVTQANKLPESLREQFIKENQNEAFRAAKRRGKLSDPDMDEFAASPDGVTKLFSLMLRPAHPHLTQRDVERIFDSASPEEEIEAVNLIHQLAVEAKKIPVSEDVAERQFFRGDRASAKFK